MKANPGKYHLLLSGKDSSKVAIENKAISSSKCEKLVGIKIVNNLNFKEHGISVLKSKSKNQCFV